MSFNLIAETRESINWGKISQIPISDNFTEVELFPIPVEIGHDSTNSVGISIPMKNVNKRAISELKIVTERLFKDGFNIYELYHGNEVTSENFSSIEKLLIG